jgi:hypothetical protein
MSGGVFTDIQSLSAQIDHANNNTPQAVRSLNTFQVGLISDLPLTSADGRTAATAAAAPEPASFVLIGLSGAVGLLFRKFRNF